VYAIEVAAVTKSFGGVPAIADASLSVAHGEIVAMLGPSGSGKSTLLRTIAGFEEPDEGTIRIDGREVVGPRTWVEPEHRRVGMVFQHGALFPHLSAAANVAFGAASPARARELLEVVGLASRASSFPHELSGGERQRIALARALAADPAVVLLDEPFAALDPALRDSLRTEVMRILRAAGATALLVTHDQAEALSLAERLVVLREGRVEQLGTPDEIYLRPQSRWVAEFVGEAEVLPGRVASGVVECELGRFDATDGPEGDVEVMIRPEHVALERPTAPNGHVEGVVLDHRSFGHDHLTLVRLPSGRVLRSRRLGFSKLDPGATVKVNVGNRVSILPRDDQSAGTAR
jgi:iron(III) transport system ATP-binding protein